MILAADIHLTDQQPTCRTDDYWEAQKKCFEFLLEQAAKDDGLLLIAGDLFNKPRASYEVISWVVGVLRQAQERALTIATPGQHDLPYHQLNQAKQSSIGVLQEAALLGTLTEKEKPAIIGTEDSYIHIYGAAYGQEPPKVAGKNKTNILLWHKMVSPSPLWPGHEPARPNALLRKYKSYDLIVTGDNHQTFVEEVDGRYLINPGSMMRMTAAQVDHKPVCFRWHPGEAPVAIPIPDTGEVIDRNHIEAQQARDERISAFVERLSGEYEVGLSFTNNLTKFFSTNKVFKAVERKVWEAVGGN